MSLGMEAFAGDPLNIELLLATFYSLAPQDYARLILIYGVGCALKQVTINLGTWENQGDAPRKLNHPVG
jgi:hypothetical protein